MLLEDRTAIVYGAGGRIGGAMARGFAAEGAWCVLVGRTPARLDAVAGQIRAAGGRAEVAVVDVCDEAAVDDHADSVAARSGGIDVSVNVATPAARSGPVLDLPVADVARAVERTLTAQLITTRAAARYMSAQGSGVILFLGVRVGVDLTEALRRQLSAELGGRGVRVVSLVTAGLPGGPADAVLLRRAATPADVARVAAFVASDRARTLTATQVSTA